MSWKKALFLGGAVMLLAACSDATAPTSLRSVDQAGAAKDITGTTSTVNPLDGTITVLGTDCKSGYYVRSGDKDICIIAIDPLF